MGDNSTVFLTSAELVVCSALCDSTVPSFAEKTRLLSSDVMEILRNLESVAECVGTEEKTGHYNDVEKNGVGQEFFVPTGDDKNLGTLVRHAENSVARSESVEKAEPEKGNVKEMESPALEEGFDFSLLSNRGLKDLVLDPRYGKCAKKLLESRGYDVLIKNEKVGVRKKRS